MEEKPQPFEKLPAELFKEIFRHLPRESLFRTSQVSKKWHQIISEEYSSSLYGKMLRFSRYFLSPVIEAIDKIDNMQSQLQYTITSYTRRQPSAWILVGFCFGYMVLSVYLEYFKYQKYLESQKTTFSRKFHWNMEHVNHLRDLYKNLSTWLPSLFTETFIGLCLNPESGIIVSLVIFLCYAAFVKYRNFQLQNTNINAHTRTVLANFLVQESVGQLIMQLLYDSTNNQYPALTNPTLTVAQLKQSFLSNKKDIETLCRQFNKSVEKLRFSPAQIVDLDNFCSKNSNFKQYLQNKFNFWNETNANIPKNVIRVYDSSPTMMI